MVGRVVWLFVAIVDLLAFTRIIFISEFSSKIAGLTRRFGRALGSLKVMTISIPILCEKSNDGYDIWHRF